MKQQITPEMLDELMRGNGAMSDLPQPNYEEEQDNNPFDRGIMKAMEAARDMIDLTGKQKGEAMASAIAKFNQGLDQSEPARGFWSNVGRVSDAFAPAYETYNTQEQSAQGKNQQLAQLVQQMQQQQLQRQALAKKENWEHRYKLDKLDMEKAYRSNKANYQDKLLEYKKNKNKDSQGEEFPLIRTDSAFDKVAKQSTLSAKFLREVEGIKEKYDELKAEMQESGIDTTDPLVFDKRVRQASGLFSSFSKDPVARSIAKKYSDLSAANKRAMQTAEKALKEGALTNFTVKYGDDSNLFPNFNEPSDIYETKLKTMYDDALLGYETASASLKSGRYINEINYPKYKAIHEMRSEKPSEKSSNSATAAIQVKMFNPKGQLGYVDQDQVEEALAIGYRLNDN